MHDGHSLEVGVQIDDFVFLYAGRRCVLGRYVHLASFVSIVGGGECLIGEFSGLSAGCRIITGSGDYFGPYLSNPTVSREYTNHIESRVEIGRHVIVGTNVVIMPGVTLGDGVAVGAGVIVRRDLEPWGIYAGSPPRRIGDRDRDAILEKRRQFLLATGTAPD